MDGVVGLYYEVDLDKGGVKPTNLGMLFATEDQMAHAFIIRVLNSGEVTSVDGCSVTGTFIREADQSTVLMNGFISNNCAVLVLDNSCYSIKGYFQLIIKLIHPDSKSRTSVFCGRGYVTPSSTNTVIDPGHTIPSVQDLIQYTQQIKAAISSANNAAAYINGITVSAHSVSPGDPPSAVASSVDGHLHIEFGLVRGEKGDKGDPGGGTGGSVAALNCYPVGALYMSIEKTSPAQLFGGTWFEYEREVMLKASGAGNTDATLKQFENIAFLLQSYGSPGTLQGNASLTIAAAKYNEVGNDYLAEASTQMQYVHIWRRTA